MSWLHLSGWHYTEGRSQAQAGMRYPCCKVRPSFYYCRPCGMKTLVLNPAVEGTSYRGSGTLHTVIPALKRPSPINAVSQLTSGSENCQNSCRGRWSEVPLLKQTLYYLNPYKPNINTTIPNQTMNFSHSFMKLEFINSPIYPTTSIYHTSQTPKLNKKLNIINTWKEPNGEHPELTRYKLGRHETNINTTSYPKPNLTLLANQSIRNNSDGYLYNFIPPL